MRSQRQALVKHSNLVVSHDAHPTRKVVRNTMDLRNVNTPLSTCLAVSSMQRSLLSVENCEWPTSNMIIYDSSLAARPSPHAVASTRYLNRRSQGVTLHSDLPRSPQSCSDTPPFFWLWFCGSPGNISINLGCSFLHEIPCLLQGIWSPIYEANKKFQKHDPQ